MNMHPRLIIGTILIGTLSVSPLTNAESTHTVLADHGIRAERAEALLPGNAIVHAKLRSPQSILENLEKLALSAIPEKAVPPPARPILRAENPLLTLLGLPIVQGPLTSESVAERLGLDSEAEITFTLYPGDPTRFFILSVGLADPETLSETLAMFIPSESITETSIGGRPMVQIRSERLPVQNLFVSCSQNRAYLTGEPSLLIHLHEPGTVPTMTEDPHMGEVVRLTRNKDLSVSLNPGLIKPFTSQLPFYKYVPLTFLSQFRSQFLHEIPEPQRKAIQEQLQLQMGISDLDEVMDYAECFVTATYEQLFNTLYDNIDGFNGATLALRLNHAYPEASFFFHHQSIQTDTDTAPIPLLAAKQALRAMGSESQFVSLQGQEQPAMASPWVSEWIDRTRELIEKKKLNTSVIDTIASLHKNTRRPNPVEADVPWTLRFNAKVNPVQPLNEFDSILELVADRQANLFVRQSRPVTVIPANTTDVLRDHFAANIEATRENRAMTENVFRKNQKPKWIVQERRLKESELDHRIAQFTLENAFISQSGFFGFNQHEFINRKVYHARALGDYLVYHQASADPQWLAHLDTTPNTSRAAALEHLIDRLPKNVNSFTAIRALAPLGQSLEWVQDAEALVHRDIHRYLKEVQDVAATTADRESLIQKIQSLPFSPAVAAINQDESGKFYCLLPGNVTFPRKQVTPLLGDLLGPVLRSAQGKGGVISYTRTHEGTKEWAVMWNTEGLSTLIRSAGNAIADQYLNNPAAIQEVMQVVMHPRDRDAERVNQILAKNPSWRFLDQVKLPRNFPVMAQTRAVAEPSQPSTPIPSRGEAVTPRQIDLSDHYNASLDDSWHRGGIQENDLKDLPHGLASIGGIDYDLRGIVQLTGRGAEQALSVTFPKEHQGIPVHQVAEQLHFLHGCGWSDPEGTRIATYVVHYEDGETVEIPLEYGIHLRDWWSQPGQADVASGDIAWIGSNGASASQNRSIQLYHLSWKNPRPETLIVQVDYRSELADAAPFLLAITAQ